jgi:HD-like signal output (HDOD) protein
MSTLIDPDVTPVAAQPVRPWALRVLPPFRAVVSPIISVVDDKDVAANQITEIIKLDPTFTAEILRVANSSLFGAAREIASVRHAVILLGLDRVKSMATFLAANAMVKPVIRIETLRKFSSEFSSKTIVWKRISPIGKDAFNLGSSVPPVRF